MMQYAAALTRHAFAASRIASMLQAPASEAAPTQ